MKTGWFIRRTAILLLWLSFASLAKSHINFTICGGQFIDDLKQNRSRALKWQYRGPVRGLKSGHHAPPLVKLEGCIDYCGKGYEPYSWEITSDTITTWVLPLVGLVLQAPFESNQRTSTFFILCRWIGSPVACLMSMFWNVKVTGRCAVILDMSVAFDQTPGYEQRTFSSVWQKVRTRLIERFNNQIARRNTFKEDTQTEFAELRDSLYLLSVLNQYEFDKSQPKAMKKLVVTALFSPALQQSPNPGGGYGHAGTPNEELEQLIEDTHLNLVQERRAIAASIRRNRKHGVVQVLVSLGWFIIAVILSIYKAFVSLGENATAHNLALGLLMAWLPVLIATSLVDRNPINSEYVKGRLEKFLKGVNSRLDYGPRYLFDQNILGRFCGQSRKAWHYGVAHSILVEFEQTFAEAARGDILQSYKSGSLVENSIARLDLELWQFHAVEFWQGVLAWLCVSLAVGGAAILSFNEPTVGLGCRSGGYMIFGILASFAWICEMAGWGIDRPGSSFHSKRKKLLFGLRVWITCMEIFNFFWLNYAILSQTFGFYGTCKCKSSYWSLGRNAYTDFTLNTQMYRDDYDVARSWYTGTVLGMLPLLLIIYVVYQWCVQSFLWAEDYDAAMRGLVRVRWWRKHIHSRWLYQYLYFLPASAVCRLFNKDMSKRLRWSK